MNNLDPEVAERPEDLVVYGGTGKAARTWPAYDAILASLRDLEDDETLLVQSGKPVGVMRTHAVGAARADRELQPGRRLGQLGGVPQARRAGPDHVRPDDGRLVDLHRHAGDPAGHVRDVRGGRRQEVRRHAGRHDHRDRRPRRHGRRPAARGDDERRGRDLHRRRPVADHAADRAPLPRRAGRLAGGRRTRAPSRLATSSGRSRSASSATPPSCCRSCWS